MGRPRKRDKHLPRRMYLVHGGYYLHPKGAKPVHLGRDLPGALTKYAGLIGNQWEGRTLGDVIDRYRAEVLPLKRSAQTRTDQGTALGRLRKAFGHMLPDNITAQHCYSYQDARRGLNGQPVPVAARHEVQLLGHVLAKAIRWGIATRNPARSLDLGPRTPKRRRVTMDQVEQLRALADERMRVAIDFAVSLGQRRGDLLNLRREQLTSAGILVKQSKTGAEVLIEWSADLEAIVARAKALTPQVPGEYLIRKRNGRPYSPGGFASIWKRLMYKVVKAGGQRFTFHDLRSVSADGAATPEEARDRLGHTDVATTKRHYLRGVVKAKPRS
jgi:integrase